MDEPTKALIFDSYYDPYRGVIVYFRVMSGSINYEDKVLLMASKKTCELDEIGIMAPDQRKVDELHAGEVGYLAASIKAVADARVGDTITLVNVADEPLPGYTEAKPMMFAIYSPRGRSVPGSARSTRRAAALGCGLGSSLKPAVPWASASTSASLVCCTWRSCRSVSSANTTWI